MTCLLLGKSDQISLDQQLSVYLCFHTIILNGGIKLKSKILVTTNTQ